MSMAWTGRIAALACCGSMPAAAQETFAATPAAVYDGRQGQVRAALPRLDAEIEVDGRLDEAVWRQAASLEGFSEYAPRDGHAADLATRVLVWYSPSALYLGVQAQAPPGSVRASLANRDRLDAEDRVQFFLSTFNDGRQALYLAVNPLGVQADGALVEGVQRGGGGFDGLSSGREEPDLSPDYVFDSRGRLTERGYEVELRVPFKSLRFPAAATQDWGLHVTRVVQASGHEDSWVPARRAAASFLAQAGVLQGLSELQRGRVLDLTPALTARLDGSPAPGVSGPGGRWRYDFPRPEPGGNVRWGLGSNLTLNGTLNPDFSQVEADAGRVVYDPRRAVFFAEKRPFFLDGIEQFATPHRLVYTRRIADPLLALKLTGKLGRTTIAALSAVDGRGTSSAGRRPFAQVLRVQRDLSARSKAALLYTQRLDGSDFNHVLGADARLALGEIWSLSGQVAAAHTRRAGQRSSGPLWEALLERNGRRFGLSWQATGIHPEFQTDSGFIDRGNLGQVRLDQRVTFFGRKGALVESFSHDLVLDGLWRYHDLLDGRGPLERKLHLNNNARLRGGWRLGVSALIERFDFDRDLYADYGLLAPGGAVLPFRATPFIRNFDWVLSLTTPDFARFSGYAQWVFGRDENFFEWSPADIDYLELQADWRPTEKLRAGAQYQLQKFDRRSDGTTVGVRHIPRLKLEYQWSRAVFLRFVGEYDAAYRDDLRDDGRSELPIVVRHPASGAYEPARRGQTNRLRVDWLFSYQPTPGTVIFAGYGSQLREARRLRFDELRRESDGFFLKVSYLFRM